MNGTIIHLSFYRFCALGVENTLVEHKAAVQKTCAELQLLGTVLLASEGINAMVSGSRESIEAFKIFAVDRFQVSPAAFKEAEVPSLHTFNRMLVKIKKEIISVGGSGIRPHEKTAPRVSAAELKVWLDQKKPIVLLDTRNKYEVEVGTFQGAEDLGLECSRDFAKVAASRKAKWKDHTVVTFCTGGIRCEKASAVLLDLGLPDVYQLDGGILRYFEENGAEHFSGHCFVFDWRMAVDGKLQPIERSEDQEKEFGRHQKKNR